MMRMVLVALLCLPGLVQAQSAGRAAAGIGQGLSDWATRQIDNDLAIERDRRRIEMELAAAKELERIRQAAPRAAVRVEPSSAELSTIAELHPQWDRIIMSTSFHGWLEKQPPTYAQYCRTTASARTLAACIDDFFGPPVKR